MQKRNSDCNNHNANTVPNIKVRVKHGSIYHEVVISCQASFGKRKKKSRLDFYDDFLIFCLFYCDGLESFL